MLLLPAMLLLPTIRELLEPPRARASAGRWRRISRAPLSPRVGRHGADALRGAASRLARRAGWQPTVLPHPGYGSGNRVRVLGRVLLAPSTASTTTTASGSTKGAAKAAATSAPTLRVPVYAAPRPASKMTQAASLTLPAGAVQTWSLKLTGRDLAQGDADPADDIFSIAAGVEL